MIHIKAYILIISLLFLVLPWIKIHPTNAQDLTCIRNFNNLNRDKDLESYYNQEQQAVIIKLGQTFNDLDQPERNELIRRIKLGIRQGCQAEINEGKIRNLIIVNELIKEVIQIN